MSHPQMVPDFETRVRKSIHDQLAGQALAIDYVDDVPAVEGSHGRVLLIDFHLEGSAGNGEQFTFPFDESIPLEQSLSILSDMIARSAGSTDAPPTRP